MLPFLELHIHLPMSYMRPLFCRLQGIGVYKVGFTWGGNFDRRSLRGSAVNRVAFSRGTFVSNQPGRKAISVDNKRMNAWRLLGDGIHLAHRASHLVTPN